MKFILLVVILFSINAFSIELESFETDLCTFYKEGTSAEPTKWRHCCIEHDLYYWVGGTKDERKLADLRLKSCVGETGETREAEIIYLGVRSGYYSPIHYKKFQWGNGWNEDRRINYSALSSEQIDHVLKNIVFINLDQMVIDNFIYHFKARYHSRLF